MAWSSTNKTWVTGEIVDATDMNTYIRDQFISVLPIATLILRCAPYTTVETAVEGRWLQCNGALVSRTTYAELFAYLNALSPALPFGVGNGTTTFALPDARGRTAYAEGEHTYVDSMGDSEGQAISSRGPFHYHQFQMEGTGAGGSYPTRGNTIDSGADASTTSYPTGAQDVPAYLVVGSYFIKYTS